MTLDEFATLFTSRIDPRRGGNVFDRYGFDQPNQLVGNHAFIAHAFIAQAR